MRSSGLPCRRVRRVKFPWANSLLLVLLVVELVSGIIGLVSGAPEKAIFIQAHGAAGYGILLLLIWKGANVLRSLRWAQGRGPAGSLHRPSGDHAFDAGPGARMVGGRALRVRLVQRHELAHLRRCAAGSCTGLALRLPDAWTSPNVLSRPKVVSSPDRAGRLPVWPSGSSVS